MTTMNKLTALLVVAGFWLMAAGSASNVYSTSDRTPVKISGGIVANKDIRIVAEDRSFELVGGQRFSTPFSVNDWPSSSSAFTTSSNMISHYETSLLHGAQLVRVYQEGHEEPLYGVLVFNDAIGAAYGPASRSYMIKIPEDKLEAARSGVTAVAYEKMNWKATWSDGSSSNKYWYGWALWLSSYPF